MANTSSWLTTFNSLTSNFLPSVTNSKEPRILEIPVNLHVFEKYYYIHASYQYLEEYAFEDKILIFNSKQDTKHLDSKFSTYFSSNLIQGKRTIKSDQTYLNTHLDSSFIDWSKNTNSETLADILKLDLSKSQQIFSPIRKNIYLDYSYSHKPIIPWYALYFQDNQPQINKFPEVSFGKHKQNPQKLINFYTSGVQWKTCQEIQDNFHNSQINYVHNIEDGYDGICENITISKNRNPNFPDGVQELWTTPYAAYKYLKESWWNEQYYYYSLGSFVSSKSSSSNLIKDSENSNLWFVNYDDVFALIPESNSKLKITLNDNSSLVQTLKSNSALLDNFLKISSLLNFDISMNNLGNKISKKFTIKEILEESVVIDFQEQNYLLSDISLSIEVNNAYDAQAKLVNSAENTYQVNLNKLFDFRKIFNKIEFEISNEKNLLPSELMQISKMAEYFYFVSEDNKKYRLTPSLLKNLQIQGEVDDNSGTVTFTYRFNDELKQIDLTGMKKIPDLSNIKINAKNVQDAIEQLKKLKPETPDYFWNKLVFKPKKSSSSWDSKLELEIFEEQSKTEVFNLLKRKNDWDFHGCEIVIPNDKDISLIPNNEIVKYKKISDLFLLSNYAIFLNLSKEDYHYQVINETDTSLTVSVALASSKITPKLSLVSDSVLTQLDQSFYGSKRYTFDLTKLNKVSTPDSKDNENIFGWLFKSENFLVTSSAGVFSGSAIFLIFKKLGFLKSKII